MYVQATPDCRSQHQLNLRLLRYTASPHREEPVMLAQDLLAARRAVDALEVVETAMEREPDDADLLLTLGVALLESGELEWARRVLIQAVQAESEWAEPWRWLGETLLKIGDRARAMRTLAKAKALDGKDPAIDKLLKSVERWDEITRRLRRFLERPELVDPALLLQDLLDDGRIDEADEVLEVALAEDEEDPDLLLLRSRVERRRGKYEEARASLRRATELDPGWEEAWSDLESLLIEMGDEDGARQVALAAKEAEREALEEALAERVAREKRLAEQRARAEEARRARRRAEEESAKAAAEAEKGRQLDESRKMQTVLARAAREADEAGKKAAKEALLRATADARAAAARRAAEEKARKDAETQAERERLARESARLAEERRKKEEAFERAWQEAEKEARERIAKMRAEKEARDAKRREAEQRQAERSALEAELAEGLRRARQAIWQQAKVEAERRIRESEAPSPRDVETAAMARAREELEAEARREAQAKAEERARLEAERAAAAEEARLRAEALERARVAARQQQIWEASSEARKAAAGRALALAAKMAEEAQKKTAETGPASSADVNEPVFELHALRPFAAPKVSEAEVDEMLDDLLFALEERGGGDTLPGMPAPGELDGGVGMRQSSVGLRLRDDGAVPYQPAAIHDTAVGRPAGLVSG